MSLARCCFFLLLIPVVFLPGCSYRLGAGLYGNDLTYLTKPIYQGDTTGRSAVYLSASGNLGRGFTLASRDFNASGLLSLHRAHTWAHGNVAYGGFLYTGTYRLGDRGFLVYDSLLQRGRRQFQGTYGYQGAGLRGSANWLIPFRRIDWRALGLEVAYSREHGTFSALRDRMNPFFGEKIGGGAFFSGSDFERVLAERELLTLGLTTELCIKRSREQEQFNVRFYAGTTLGEYSTFYESASVHLNVTFAYQNENSGWAGYAQLANPLTKTTLQVGMTQRLGRVRERR